jgi:hypothetical protein
VGTVAVTIGVLAVTGEVGKEGCTALELGVVGGDTSVDNVDTRSFTGAGVVGVGSGSSLAGLVGHAGQAPSRGTLGGVGLLLEGVDLAKVSLDNSILLDVFNLGRVSM